jgi:hypothetical protein
VFHGGGESRPRRVAALGLIADAGPDVFEVAAGRSVGDELGGGVCEPAGAVTPRFEADPGEVLRVEVIGEH